MQAGTDPALRPKSTDELEHIVCCRDDEGTVSFCGLDVSDCEWAEGDGLLCVVCDSLDNRCCPFDGIPCGQWRPS